tara:strand:- start:302 stop:424 length:123 start_codon:yes stop_codon:yes gene_type:complete
MKKLSKSKKARVIRRKGKTERKAIRRKQAYLEKKKPKSKW